MNRQHKRVGPGFWVRFGRWMRSRPFIGGLLVILSGLEIFYSTQLSLGGLKFQLGPTGFLSWLIPTILVACGLLLWLSPQQRLFYGIVGSLTAVYALIGVNLGGFVVGTVLGVVGGGLGFAWVPVPQQPPGPTTDAGEPDGDADGTAGEPEPEPEHATVDQLMTGPLTDVLPAPVNPLTGGPLSGEEQPPLPTRTRPDEITQPLPTQQGGPPNQINNHPDEGEQLPRRSPRLFAITLVPLVLSAVVLTNFPKLQAAYAAPCTTSSSSSTAEQAATGTSPTPSPSPSATSSDSNPISDLINGIGDAIGSLLGTDESASPSPGTSESPSASPSASASPTPSCSSASASPTPSSSSSSGSGSSGSGSVKAEDIDPPAGQPFVQAVPAKMTGTLLDMSGFSYDGVTELPLKSGGTIRVLQFSMDKSVTTNFELQPILGKDNTHSLKSSSLTVEKASSSGAKVKFFTSKFVGKLVVLGVPIPIPLTFTPDSPPPLTLPQMTFADIDIQLVYVDSEKLIANNLVDTRLS